MVLDSNLDYVAANDAYCEVVDRSREELLGRGLFEMFPNSDEGGRLLKASLERVLTTGKIDSIAYIPYAIPRSESRGGGFEMRYWSAAHTPLFDSRGRVEFIVQNTVDVTELHELREIAQDGYSGGESQLIQRAREVQQTNQSLLQESAQLRDLFLQAPGFMAVIAGPDLVFELVNNAYLRLIGDREVIGRPLATALPEVADQGFVELLHRVMASGEPFVGRAVSVQLRKTPSGPLEERFLDFIYQPIFDAKGVARGVFVEGSDVTDGVRAQEQQRLLLDELNHRVKNSLATVQSIAAQTLRNNPEPQAFRSAFEARLLSLSATHNLLTASSWRGAALIDILAFELGPHGVERYDMDGVAVELTSNEALALCLLFHELATNAAKYGALSRPQGHVSIDWHVEQRGEEARLELNWVERGGPPVAPPSRRGFGSRLIERSLQGEIGGAARLDFQPEGLRCSVSLPLRSPAYRPITSSTASVIASTPVRIEGSGSGAK